MKALRFHGRGDLRIEEVAPPAAPSGGNVKVRVAYCGICGTDLHEYLAGPVFVPTEPHPSTGAAAPMILGHEFSAVVEEIGPDVSGFKAGDRVAILPHLMPKGDYYVRRNLGQFSPAVGLVGLSWHWGGMGEHAVVPEENLVLLPDAVSDLQGALLEPLAVAVNAIDEAGLRVGQSVLITGAGPIGALTAFAARAAGAARIFVHDPNRRRLAQLERFDDFRLFSGPPAEVLNAISGETEAGVDVAIECAAQIAAYDLCVDALRHVGVLALVGLFVEKQPVDLFRLCEKGVRLIGCLGNDITMGPRLVAMIESGSLPVETVVTGVIPLDEAVENGFDVLARPGTDQMKILVNLRG
ncbi:MAG: alcohol dehydrogenase catalytic domain-containing protein [Rhodobacteraceae bacterium]|nr:alcohol dehydrogenase catalytic domain-containing protein [Paracoccaceae bacterium]